MAAIDIYHNPRCGKSRTTLKLIQEAGIEPNIRLYLQDTPTQAELRSIIKKLGIPAEGLIRKGEKIFKEQYKGQELDDAGWIKAMADHPILIERPIVIKGDKAVLGRPPENVSALV